MKHHKILLYLLLPVPTMADRYGDDMAFKKMMEEMTESNSASTNNALPMSKGGDKKDVAKKGPDTSKSCKELDKSSWEYWEKHVPNRFNPYDGRSVLAIEEHNKDGGNNDLTRSHPLAGNSFCNKNN